MPADGYVAGKPIRRDPRQELAAYRRSGIVVDADCRAPGGAVVVRESHHDVRVVALVHHLVGIDQIQAAEPRAGRIPVIGQTGLGIHGPHVLRRDEIEPADVGRGRRYRGAEVAGAETIGVDVDADRRRSLTTGRVLAGLNDHSGGRDRDVAEAAAGGAGDVLQRIECADRAQSRHCGAARPHRAALVPDDPDRYRRSRSGGVFRHDRRLVHAARERGKRVEIESAIRADQDHHVGHRGVEVAEVQVAKSVPRQCGVTACGRTLAGVAVRERPVHGVRIGPGQTAVGAARGEQAAGCVVAGSEKLVLVGRIDDDRAFVLVVGQLRHVDVGALRHLSACRRAREKQADRRGKQEDDSDGQWANGAR